MNDTLEWRTSFREDGSWLFEDLVLPVEEGRLPRKTSTVRKGRDRENQVILGWREPSHLPESWRACRETSHDMPSRIQADGLVLATRGSLGSRDPDPFVRLMFSEEAFLPQPATPSLQRARNHPPGKTSSIQGCRSFSTRRRHAFIPPLKGVGFRLTFCKPRP